MNTVKLFRERSSGSRIPFDRIDRANLIACSALNATFRVDYIDRISCTDDIDRTYRFAGTAGYTVVSNEMCTHDSLLLA